MRVNNVILKVTLLTLFLCFGCFNPKGDFDMKLIVEVSMTDIIHILSDEPGDTVLNRSLMLAEVKQSDSKMDYITLFGEAVQEADPGKQLAPEFLTALMNKGINSNSTNEEVLTVIRNEVSKSIAHTSEALRKRLQNSGISKRAIKLEVINNRIHLTIEGIDNPHQIRKLITTQGKLEFWETFDNRELSQKLIAADRAIYEYLAGTKELISNEKTENIPEPQIKEDASLMEQREISLHESGFISQFAEEIHPLLDILNTMQDQSNDRPISGATIGKAYYKDTSQIDAYLRIARGQHVFPHEIRFLWSAYPTVDDNMKPTDIFALYVLKAKDHDGNPALSGDIIISAKQEFDETSNEPYVSMKMNDEGTKMWAAITRDNVGKPICVVVDDKVYSSPIVYEEILGGNSNIQGNFTIDEAQDLAAILNSSSIPYKLNIISENITKHN